MLCGFWGSNETIFNRAVCCAGRRDKLTTPSLNIELPNEDAYYISLSPSNHTLSRLHLVFDGVKYTAYDDSLYYGERNFDTGEQIAQ